MQSATIVAILVFVGAALAAPGIDDHHGHHDYHAHPKYKYSYGVNDKHTGDYKTANEYRDGHVTKGSYSVLQPDGVLRTVNYVVDGKNGFQAEVINKGVGHHGHDHGHKVVHDHGYHHHAPKHSYAVHHGHGYGYGDDGSLGFAAGAY